MDRKLERIKAWVTDEGEVYRTIEEIPLGPDRKKVTVQFRMVDVPCSEHELSRDDPAAEEEELWH
jgi:hypothetical protein